MITFANWSYKRFDPDAVAYFNNIAANGGSISNTSKAYINKFVLQMKAQGFWSSMIEIYPFMGNQLAAALTKLKYVTATPYLTNYNFVNGDYVETGTYAGLKGDGATKYLDSGVALNSGYFGVNNSCSGVYKTLTNNSAVTVEIGTVNPNFYVASASNGDFASTGSPTVYNFSPLAGMTVASNGATQYALYSGGVSVSTSSPGSFPTTYNLNSFVFAGNLSGGVSFYSYATLGFGFLSADIGAAGQTNLYNLVQSLQTSLGRQA